METKADDFREEIGSWSDVSDLIEHFSFFSGHDWLFRGAANADFQLIPNVGRRESRKRDKTTGEPIAYRPEDERAVLAMFKQQARFYLSSTPANDFEWLAIAQHFGLPTRLLDWTDSLLVATWFAVQEGQKDHGGDSAIWVVRGVPTLGEEDITHADPFALKHAVSYRPPHISSRISSQGSILVICPEPTRALALPNQKKIIIKRRVEATLEKRLNTCGVNRRNIFADLSGLAQHLAWLYRNDWLSGYKESGPRLTEDEYD